jgi:phage gpG-like protein
MAISLGLSLAVEDAAISAALRQLHARLADMTPVYRAIGGLMLTSTKMRFETLTAPNGQAWAPLSDRTLVARVGGAKKLFTKGGGLRKGAVEKLQGAARTPLRRSGRLYQSLNYKADRAGVEWGSNAVYAGIQNNGGMAGRGRKVRIPARTFVGISEQDRNHIIRLAARHLEQAR